MIILPIDEWRLLAELRLSGAGWECLLWRRKETFQSDVYGFLNTRRQKSNSRTTQAA